jgi:hypothetical protein
VDVHAERLHDRGSNMAARTEIVRDSAISVIFFVEAEVEL